MKRRQLALFILVFMGLLSCGNAAYVEHAAEWWHGQTVNAKYEYVGATFDGKTVGSNLLGFGMSAQVRVKAPGAGSVTTGLPDHVQIDGGQLVEWLDRFYSDPRNANIPVSKASMVLVYRAAGMPRDALLAMIDGFRKPGC